MQLYQKIEKTPLNTDCKREKQFIKPLPPSNDFLMREISLYRVHSCEEIIDISTKINIDITVIPEGMTDVYQPLNNKIHWIVKA